MADDEYLEIMRRVDERMARMEVANKLASRRADESAERNRLAFEDLRAYIAEATLVLQGLTSALSALRGSFDEETRAQRRALFAILDRLEGNRPQPGTA